MIPVVICTLGSKSLDVLKASFAAYAPEVELIIHHVERSTFGESYNTAMEDAFQKYDEIIIANDDIVLTPTTMQQFLDDLATIKKDFPDKLGLVATMADNVRLSQSIRNKFTENDVLENSRWTSEAYIKQVPVLAPIFAWISKEAFSVAKFPPINWFSDDIICEDLSNAGYKHFVTRAYVHHAFSQTVGTDYEKLSKEAMTWIDANRPEYSQNMRDRKYIGKPK